MALDCLMKAWQDHEKELRGYLVHSLRDVHAADDVLQEVFLKSLRQGDRFCEIGNPRAWLFQVARRALIDQSRLKKPNIELSESLAVPEEEERSAVDELDACMLRNLSEMASDDREIIEQCDLQGVKQLAYAQTQGLSLAAVKSRLLRARQRLREALTSNCQVRFDETGHVCCHVPRAPSH